MELPLVDEHAVPASASAEATWAALLRWWDGLQRRRGVRGYARLVGCDDPSGFHVAASDPPRVLRLEGGHRFARYALTFRTGDGELRAETRARFPGPLGAAYRALVIRTGAHAALTRRLLRGIAESANARTDPANEPPGAG